MKSRQGTPSYLFFTEKNEDADYSYSAPGIFKVEKMMQGLPAWQQPAGAEEQKKKVIVLSDWSTRDLPNLDKAHREDILLELLGKGFELVYYDKLGNIINVTTQDIASGKIWDCITHIPVVESVVEAAAMKKKKLPKEAVFVLNDHWMNILSSDDADKVARPRELNYFSLASTLTSDIPDHFETFLKYAVQTRPIYSVTVQKAPPTVYRPIVKESYADYSLQIYMAAVSRLHVQARKMQYSEYAVEAACKGFDENVFAATVTELMLNSESINPEVFNNPEVFKKFSHLKTIELRGSITQAIESLVKCDLSNIEELRIIDASVDLTILSGLLLKMPKLKHLTLCGNKYAGYWLEIDKLNLRSVKIDKLPRRDIIDKSTDVTKELLKICDRAKYPYIDKLNENAFTPGLSHINPDTMIGEMRLSASLFAPIMLVKEFQHVESLAIDSGFVKASVLKMISGNHLKALKIHGMGNQDVVWDWLRQNHRNLEHLEIDRFWFKDSDLDCLAMPNLKVLSLDRCSLPLTDFYEFLARQPALDSLVLSESARFSPPSTEMHSYPIGYKNLTVTITSANYKVISNLILMNKLNLESLSISTAVDITSKEAREFMTSIGDKLAQVKSLQLLFPHIQGEVPNLSDYLINTYPALENLKIHSPRMSFIGASNLPELLDKMPKLVTVAEDRQYFTDKLQEANYRLLQERKIIYINGADHQPSEKKTSGQHQQPAAPQAEDRAFDPAAMQQHAPKTEFRFSGDESCSQGMIIDRLACYIAHFHPEYSSHLIDISEGVCQALSLIFIDMRTEDWKKMLEVLKQWNGKPETFYSDTHKYLQIILDKWKKVYLDKSIAFSSQTFVGDAFDEFLTSGQSRKKFLVADTSFLLTNGWHAIAVKYKDNNWRVYDPNFHGGFKTIPVSDVQAMRSAIKASLGSCFTVNNVDRLRTTCKLSIASFAEYLKNGLFILLDRMDNGEAVIKFIADNVKAIAKMPVEVMKDGVLIRDIKGQPAFLRTLFHESNVVSSITLIMLLKIKNSFADPSQFAALIANSLQGMSVKNPAFAQQDYTAKFLALISKAAKYDPAYTELLKLIQGALDNCLKNIVQTKKQDAKKITDIVKEKTLSIADAVSMENEKEKAEISLGIKKEKEKKPEAVSSGVKGEEPNKPNRVLEMEEKLQTWVKQAAKDVGVLPFTMQVTKPADETKIMVETHSGTQTEAFILNVLQHCQKIGRPVFYVDSPNDLICSAPYIERDGKKGFLKKGLNGGGRLYEFLQAHRDKANPPVIVLNYNKFKPDDVIKFNGLLDDMRHADGVPLPECAIVLAAMNVESPTSYQGEDLSSRFSKIHDLRLGMDLLTHELPALTINPVSEDTPETYKINLFHAQDWEERLMGRWLPKGDGLVFEEGLLVEAVKSGKPIEIVNGDWDNPAIGAFCRRAIVTGKFQNANTKIDWPEPRRFFKSDGYPAQLSLSAKQIDRSGFYRLDESVPVNPFLLNEFFTRYKCDNQSKTLDTIESIVAEHAGKTLHVNVLRDLDQHKWADLLSHCEKLNVQLVCHYADNVAKTPLSSSTPPATAIVETNDIDATVAQLSLDKQSIVIDVTDYEPSDLLMKLSGILIEKPLHFEFTEMEGALLALLNQNKQVTLRGRLTPTMADALTPLILKRQHMGDAAPGKLSLVTDNAFLLNTLPAYSYPVTAEMKQSILKQEFGEDKIAAVASKLETEKLCQLRARLQYLARKKLPEKVNADDAWKGIKDLPGRIKLKVFDKENYKAIAEGFTQDRLDAVNDVLAVSPFVVLTGLSGVGKSTFVEKTLVKDLSLLYKGEASLKRCFTDKKPGKTKYFFLTEANATKFPFNNLESMLEGNPRGMTIDGVFHEYHPETDGEIKFIFDLNPLSYGGERKVIDFFERHGCAQVFEPMPLEFIYEFILKPVFANTLFESQSMDISLAFLNMYKDIVELSKEEILISPREVQMMALLTLSHLKRYPDADPMDIARQYAKVIGEPLISSVHEKAATRQSVVDLLNDFLELAELRQTNPDLNEAQLYGGLGGIIIEGQPGIGKSKTSIDVLLERGYQQVDLRKDAPIPDKAFCIIPVSMSKEEKTALLIKACDNGVKVIMDEINSSPMMERLVNDLLMQMLPDGKRPKKPGFMIIGTQNPPTMGGRRILSKAIDRRTVKADMPAHTRQEMIDILQDEGISRQNSEWLVEAFINMQKKALDEHLSPVPTFRDLMRVAKYYVEPEQKLESKAALAKQSVITIPLPPATSPTLFQHTRDLTKELTIDLLTQLLREQQKSTWTATAEDSSSSLRVFNQDKVECFKVDPDRLTTRNQDEDTFKTILLTVKVSHPKIIPVIKAPDQTTKEQWIKACEAVYADKAGIDWDKQIELRKTAQSSPVMERPH